MRVLHLGAGNIYGGIERALVAYAAGRGACPEMEPSYGLAFPGQFESDLRAEGVDVTVLGPARLSRRASLTAARSNLRKLLARCQPDVVLVHGPWAHCVFGPTVRQAAIPLALFFHNPPRLSCVDLLARSIRPELVLTNSEYTLSRTRWWLGSTPAVVCTCPINSQLEIDRSEARKKLGIRPDTVLVLQVSRLEPYKGHRLHLRALAELKGDLGWSAWFVGAAQPRMARYQRSLFALRESLGLSERVHFLGHRTDISALLAAADVFCHPNVQPEPFGLAFVEAMQLGLPVVATRMGGAEQILASGGGLLVPPNSAAVAGALRALLGDKEMRVDIGRRGRELAAQRYSLEAGVRELAQHLSKLVQSDSASTGARAWA